MRRSTRNKHVIAEACVLFAATSEVVVVETEDAPRKR